MPFHAKAKARVAAQTPWRDGTTHLVMSPLECIKRLAALTHRAHHALANDCFMAVNLGSRMPGLGREFQFAGQQSSR